MTRRTYLTKILVVLSLVGCVKKAPLPDLPPGRLRELPTDSVESVVFWIGDAGDADWNHAPVLRKLATDVEQWASVVGRDSAVAVVFLGDNVYPGGLRGPSTRPEYWEDSTRLEAQVNVMRAPATHASRSSPA